jgi:hypothetical protein
MASKLGHGPSGLTTRTVKLSLPLSGRLALNETNQASWFGLEMVISALVDKFSMSTPCALAGVRAANVSRKACSPFPGFTRPQQARGSFAARWPAVMRAACRVAVGFPPSHFSPRQALRFFFLSHAAMVPVCAGGINGKAEQGLPKLN